MSGLSIRGLTIAGAASAGARPAVEDVSFSAPRGAITAVLGAAEGAGKTLLLAGVGGVLKTAAGRGVPG